MRRIYISVLSVLFFTLLLITGRCSAEVTEKDVLFYMSLDGTTDVYVADSNSFIRADFRRGSLAYTPDFVRAEPDQPRYVEGRFGKAVFIEAGNYGDFRRGTMNNLSLRSSKADGFPDGFVLTGQARGIKEGRGLVGGQSLKVTGQAGGGIETQKATLPVAMRYIGSVYLKGEKGGEKISLVLEDITNNISQKTEVTLESDWQRVFVTLPYNEREKKFGDKGLKEPIEAVLRIIKEDNGTFYLDALMLEQAGMHYSSRFTPSTWIEGRDARSSEVFNIPVTPETFSPETGTITFWMKNKPAKVNRTLFSVGYGWNTPLKLDIMLDGRLSYSYFGKRGFSSFKENTEWSFVAITWERNKSIVYIDGEKIFDVAAEKGFVDEDVQGKNIFIMPGNAESGYPFAAKTHINGMIDEVYLFKKSFGDTDVNYLKDFDRPLILPSGIIPVYGMPVRSFSRDRKIVPLILAMKNLTGEDINNVQTRFLIEGVDIEPEIESFPLRKNSEQEVIYQFPVERLTVGTYRVVMLTSTKNKTFNSSFTFSVGPYRNPDRLPVLAWNAGSGSLKGMERVKNMGVNVIPGTSQREVDWATSLGLYNEARIGVHGGIREGINEDRILKNDGTYDGVNPSSEYVKETARQRARRYAEGLKNLDTVRYSIINTEWQLPMDFSPSFRKMVMDRFNIDMSKWMPSDLKSAWAYLHPYNRLNATTLGEGWFPSRGVVDTEKDNFYRFHLWWHTQGPNEQAINNICLEEIKKVRPDIKTIMEPILRRPPVKVYRKNTDVAEEWFYYENPRVTVSIQERLAAASRGIDMRPSGMPQFLFKPGGAAPFAVTPPPDMFREVVWLCASRPLSMMSFWGWHRVLDKGKLLLIEEIEEKFKGLDWKKARELANKLGGEGGGLFIPEVQEEFANLSNTLWEPYGSLMMKWENYPRKVAMINSFASHLYHKGSLHQVRWPGPGWLGDTLTLSGIPYDTLYDEDFFENGNLLKDYEVVVLPGVYAIPDSAYRQILEFVRRGGIVMADDVCTVEGIPGMQSFKPEQKDEVKKFLRERTTLPVGSKTEDIIWNILEYKGARYLVVVNDKREFGRYLGQWEKVKDKGIAQRADFVVDKDFAGYVIDLTSSKVVDAQNREGEKIFSFEIGPTAGKIFMFVDDVPEKVSVKPRKRSVLQGETLEVTISIEGKNGMMQGGVPFNYTVVQPSGAVFDISGNSLIENGRYVLSFVIPVNAETGNWRITAKEFSTGLGAASDFLVSAKR
jgi:hypothetical protein